MKLSNCPTLTAVDLAYLAGLFDGEGTAGMHTYSQVRGSSKRPVKKATMAVQMTDPDPVRFFALCFPGSYQSAHLTPSAKAQGYKPVYRWQCSARNARLVAAQLIPYSKNLAKIQQLQAVFEPTRLL